MSLASPIVRRASFTNSLAATPSNTSPGQLLTASATPHAKGAYVELIASAPHDVYGLTLLIGETRVNATRTDMMLDLAIGAASSERVILPEYLCGWTYEYSLGASQVYLPFFIPRGTRIAARIQALIASDTAEVAVFLHGGASGPGGGNFFRAAHAYGTVAASSIGTSHTPGDAGAESTAASIGGTLSRDYGAVLFKNHGTLADVSNVAQAYHWELQVNGITRGEWWSNTATTERRMGPFPSYPIQTNLVSGAQLQVRAECSGTAEAQDVAFYCFY